MVSAALRFAEEARPGVERPASSADLFIGRIGFVLEHGFQARHFKPRPPWTFGTV